MQRPQKTTPAGGRAAQRHGTGRPRRECLAQERPSEGMHSPAQSLPPEFDGDHAEDQRHSNGHRIGGLDPGRVGGDAHGGGPIARATRVVVGAARQPDAAGKGVCVNDIPDPNGNGHTSWIGHTAGMMPPACDSYQIALGICLNPTIANLGCAGRCVSATHEAPASVRLQTHCMVMGQGVGTCAAMALDANVAMALVNIRDLQARLRKDGVDLTHVPETGESALVEAR